MFKVIRKADIVLAVLFAALAVFLIAAPFKKSTRRHNRFVCSHNARL